jgi:hypothetical protein
VSRSSDDLAEILEQSEARNAVNAITGALLVTHDHYVQMLEGQREAVEACYQRIRRDARHSHLDLIVLGPAEVRLFPDWSMSAVHLSEGDARASLSDSNEIRPEALHASVVERLFLDLAAGLKRH